MKQEAFEAENRALWDEIEHLIDDLQKRRAKRKTTAEDQRNFPRDYRRLCSHYALARSRRFSPTLVAYLHSLVLRGHPLLYRKSGGWLWRILEFLFRGFPRALRRNRNYFYLSLATFLLPALSMGIGCFLQEDLIYSVMPEENVSQMESSYDPANEHPGRSPDRGSETDFTMFGFYIMNNIGIGFRTFAMGILLGVGTLFLLFYNGVVIGGVAGHLSRLGYQETFWPFVSGHGSFELTAIVICGAAGLMLGKAILAPGPFGRLEALRQNASEALLLVMGAALMLLVAAFIEAFWSSSGFAPLIKYSVAALLWLWVILYLVLMGRGQGGSR